MTQVQYHFTLVLDSFGGGGAEKVMTFLAGEFARLGAAVTVIVGDGEGPWRAHLPAEARLVDLGVKSKLALAHRLPRALRREASGVVLVTGVSSIVLTLAARKLGYLKAAVVVRERSTFSLEWRMARTGRLFWPFRHFLYRGADRVVCVSQGVRKDFLRTVRFPTERTHTVYNPVALSFGDPVSPAPDHPFLRDPTVPVILSVCRLSTEKDHFTLLRAFQRARAARPIRLIILGEGQERPVLEGFVRDNGLAADVSLPGFRTDAPDFMRHCDLFVLSSRFEGMPNTLLQALFSGCRVVSTDCPHGPREILDCGRYGTLVPIGDSAALSDVILSALDKPAVPLDPTFAARFAPERIGQIYFDLLRATAGA